MLEIKNVTKVFNPGTVNEKLALDNFSLSGTRFPRSYDRYCRYYGN